MILISQQVIISTKGKKRNIIKTSITFHKLQWLIEKKHKEKVWNAFDFWNLKFQPKFSNKIYTHVKISVQKNTVIWKTGPSFSKLRTSLVNKTLKLQIDGWAQNWHNYIFFTKWLYFYTILIQSGWYILCKTIKLIFLLFLSFLLKCKK